MLHHLAFRTDHLVALASFYEGLFSFPRTRGDERSVWLDAGGGALLMLERRGPGESAVSTDSLELVAFFVPRSEMKSFRARLAHRGITIEGETAFTLYFRDPDGRRVGASCYPEAATPSL